MAILTPMRNGCVAHPRGSAGADRGVTARAGHLDMGTGEGEGRVTIVIKR